MKRLLISIIFSLLILNLFHNPVAAKETDTVIIGRDEVISSDLVKYGSSLNISGKVDGDAYLAGGLVNFDGNVTGDLFVAGGKVNINGQVGGNLRIAGGDVLVNGKIGKNLTIAGGNVQIENISVPGSLMVTAGNLEDKASIGLGGKMAVGRANINGSFGKDVKMVSGDELIIGPNANIAGTLTYGGPKEANIDKNAKITGGVKFDKNLNIPRQNIPQQLQQGTIINIFNKVRMTFMAVSFFFSLAIGFILLRLIPDKSQRLMLLLNKNPVSSFGWGILIMIVSAIIIIFLIASIIGIPLALLYLFILTLMFFLAKIIGSLVIGRKLLLLLRQGERRGWALLVGLIIYYLLSPIQVIGVIYRIIVLVAGLGVFVVYYKNREIGLEKSVEKRRVAYRKRKKRKSQ